MALNIKNREVEQLLADVVRMTGESKTEAVRNALAERKNRLAIRFVIRYDEERLLNFLEDEIWSQIPPERLGVQLSKEEEEAILGYGELGV